MYGVPGEEVGNEERGEAMKKTNTFSPEEYVDAYLTCATMDDVAKKLNISLQKVYNTRIYYRRIGIKLPSKRTKVEVDKLNKMIEDHNTKNGQVDH